MPLKYKIRPEIQLETVKNHPALRTTQGGLVLLDNLLVDLWRFSDGKTLEEILMDFRSAKISALETRAALACLAEGGLLSRKDDPLEYDNQVVPPDLTVSAVIVGHNSRSWLEKCIPSLLSQTLQGIEIILVDNASSDSTLPWVNETYPSINTVRLDKSQSLAQALNQGASNAPGDYLLIINPDVVLEPSCLAVMASTAMDRPDCAAVAAKLKLSATPGFLNGIGNYVGPVSWGTDFGLGQLDLGHFDQISAVPSACFAAALIPSEAYKKIGPFDPGFPLYYEDSEWCYRARLYGYKILSAPGAVGHHAFGQEQVEAHSLPRTPSKLQNVVYGRLRFMFKLLSPAYLFYFLAIFTIESVFRLLGAVVKGRWHFFRAYFDASLKMIESLKEILGERRSVQSKRKFSDRELFLIHQIIPQPLMKYGIPVLSLDIIQRIYLPVIITGKTFPLPEFDPESGFPDEQKIYQRKKSIFSQMASILRIEGISGLINQTGRLVAWRLNRM